MGMGPVILGHDHRSVVAAVSAQIAEGVLLGGVSEIQLEAARLICDIVPCAERIRFGTTGSGVIHAALRLARAATGRSEIVKFEGHYHGWLDSVMWSVAPGPDEWGPPASPQPVAGTAGQIPSAADNLTILAWNDLESVRQRLGRKDVAAVIMEPIMFNNGAVLPREGYLDGVREACTESGTLLIFDEMVTGFRVAPGGAQELFGVTPDLATIGKAMANGFPVSALVGRSDLIEMLDSGRVFQGGTFNGHAASMAAIIATLEVLQTTDAYSVLESSGRMLSDGIRTMLIGAGIAARVEGPPQIFHVGVGLEERPFDYRDVVAVDKDWYQVLLTALTERGVRALPNGKWILSAAHTSDVVADTLTRFESALAAVA